MRRAPLFLLLVAATCTSALADPPAEDVLRPVVPSAGRYYIEPHGGINLTLLSGNPVLRWPISVGSDAYGDPIPVSGEGATDMFNSASGFAPLLGVNLGYRFDKLMGLELDLAWDSRNASNSGVTQDTATIYDESSGQPIGMVERGVDKKITIGADYFSIGLALTAHLDPIMLSIGPVYSVALADTVWETDRWQSGDPPVSYFRGFPDNTSALMAGVDSTTKAAARLSLRIGAAAVIPIATNIDLVPRVAFDLGLSDMFSSSGDYGVYLFQADPAGKEDPTADNTNYFAARFNKAIRSSALQASLGIRFNL